MLDVKKKHNINVQVSVMYRVQ